MCSLIPSLRKTLPGMTGLLDIFRTSCAQQMCSKCQAVDDMGTDCEQCGKRTHVFWENKVGKFIDYLQLSRPFPDKIYVISHNSRGYDAQFLLRRFFGIEMGA